MIAPMIFVSSISEHLPCQTACNLTFVLRWRVHRATWVRILWASCWRKASAWKGEFIWKMNAHFVMITWCNAPRTARGAKVDQVKQTFASYGNKLEVVSVQDVASDDLSGSLKGVDKVIHAAAPQHTTGDIDTILKVTDSNTRCKY